jgi:hypothetical protein
MDPEDSSNLVEDYISGKIQFCQIETMDTIEFRNIS